MDDIEQVTLGGTHVRSYSVKGDSIVTTRVGLGSSGTIVITGPGGTAMADGFQYVPTLQSCKLPTVLSGAVDLGFPRNPSRIPSTGTVNVSVIFVDFPDNKAFTDPEELFRQYLSPLSEEYLKAVSYGRLDLSFTPHFDWIRMSKPSEEYMWSSLTFDQHRVYIQEALDLADPIVDFSESDGFVIISSPFAGTFTLGPAFTASVGVNVEGKRLKNGATSGKDLLTNKYWFVHEFGHMLGLVDLYAYNGNGDRFVGDFSLMGKSFEHSLAPEFFGWERWLLGWIDDDQVICGYNSSNNKATLTPIEVAGGIKILAIPINEHTSLVVESRQPLGYDERIPKGGPLVYIVDVSVPSGMGTIRILPAIDSDNKKHDAIMSPGQTIRYENISVQFLSADDRGDHIEYSIN